MNLKVRIDKWGLIYSLGTTGMVVAVWGLVVWFSWLVSDDPNAKAWRYVTTHDCKVSRVVPDEKRWDGSTVVVHSGFTAYTCSGVTGWIFVDNSYIAKEQN